MFGFLPKSEWTGADTKNAKRPSSSSTETILNRSTTGGHGITDPTTRTFLNWELTVDQLIVQKI